MSDAMGSTKALVGASANGGLPVQWLPSLGYAWLVAQGLSDRPAGLFAMRRELTSLSDILFVPSELSKFGYYAQVL